MALIFSITEMKYIDIKIHHQYRPLDHVTYCDFISNS